MTEAKELSPEAKMALGTMPAAASEGVVSTHAHGEPQWHWSKKTMFGFLAQAFDEAVPEGATGYVAAKAISGFLDDCGFVIVPRVPTQDMHVGAEDVTGGPCLAMACVSKDPIKTPTPSSLACQVWDRMVREFEATAEFVPGDF